MKVKTFLLLLHPSTAFNIHNHQILLKVFYAVTIDRSGDYAFFNFSHSR